MNVFFCDIVGTINGYENNKEIRNEKLKTLISLLSNLCDDEPIYFCFISSDNYNFVKKYIDELKNLLDGTNVISNIHYSNDLIDDNGIKYDNPYFSKWEQIDSFIKDNRYIKNLYYAEDSVINVEILEEIINEKYSDINYIKFIPGTDVHDTNTFCSDKKGIDALLSIINEYIESKNKKKL